MADQLSVSVLLARALVAFTIEFDNEFELQMPHSTTTPVGAAAPPRAGPWLVSQAMWSNAIQYIAGEGIGEGIKVGELHRLARTKRINLAGLTRWRYVTVSGDSDPIVRVTRAGQRAVAVWAPLATEIETRWRSRYGVDRIDEIKTALATIVDACGLLLPRYLPITSPTQNGRAELAVAADAPDGDRDLSVLLAQALQLFELDFETEFVVSLPISANVLRVLESEPIRLRDLPGLSGIARPGIDMALGFLKRRDCASVGADPHASRGQVATLTDKGLRAQRKYRSALAATEEQWHDHYGAPVGILQEVLESLDIVVTEPYPDGWRATVRPLRLPDFPMVLHRGGYPDGS